MVRFDQRSRAGKLTLLRGRIFVVVGEAGDPSGSCCERPAVGSVAMPRGD